MNFIKSPLPSSRVVKLLLPVSAGSPQTASEEDLLKASRNSSEKHRQLNSGWRWTVKLFSGAEQLAPAFGSAAIS